MFNLVSIFLLQIEYSHSKITIVYHKLDSVSSTLNFLGEYLLLLEKYLKDKLMAAR